MNKQELNEYKKNLIKFYDALEKDDKDEFLRLLQKYPLIDDTIHFGKEPVILAYARILLKAISKWMNN
jgi:hypothetical protein